MSGMAGPASVRADVGLQHTLMLRAGYYSSQRELLVDGSRRDYEQFAVCVRQALATTREVTLTVQSTGEVQVSHFLIRTSAPPNRIGYESGKVIFSLAPALETQFLSFIQFPSDSELPGPTIPYHHHYDGAADDGTHVALDSLPVVFTLERA
jgi:hypothetical protein